MEEGAEEFEDSMSQEQAETDKNKKKTMEEDENKKSKEEEVGNSNLIQCVFRRSHLILPFLEYLKKKRFLKTFCISQTVLANLQDQ